MINLFCKEVNSRVHLQVAAHCPFFLFSCNHAILCSGGYREENLKLKLTMILKGHSVVYYLNTVFCDDFYKFVSTRPTSLIQSFTCLLAISSSDKTRFFYNT